MFYTRLDKDSSPPILSLSIPGLDCHTRYTRSGEKRTGVRGMIVGVVLVLLGILFLASRGSATPTPAGAPAMFSSNARRVQNELITPMRRIAGAMGVNLIVTSFGRTPERNMLVGGVTNSCHLTWSAVDIVIIPKNRTVEFFDRIKGSLRAGELFLERNPDGTVSHIHASIFPCGGQGEIGEIFKT